MKEELTTKMHSEFSVDTETDIKHKVWTVMSRSRRDNTSIETLLPIYGLSKDQFDKYEGTYNPK